MQRAALTEAAGRYREAAAAYREACRLAASFAPSDERAVFAISSLAAMDMSLGWLLDAEHEYRRALAILERSSGRKSFNYAVVLSSIAAIYTGEQRPAEAIELLHESLAILTSLRPPDDPGIAVVQNYLAQALLCRKDYQEAELLLDKAREVFEKRPDHGIDYALNLSNLGVARHLQNRYNEAIALFNQAVRLVESSVGTDHPILVRILNNEAAAYAKAKCTQDADVTFRRALEIAKNRLGADHPEYGAVLQNYGEFLRETGHRREAKAIASRSKAILGTAARRNGIGSTIDISGFAPKQ